MLMRWWLARAVYWWGVTSERVSSWLVCMSVVVLWVGCFECFRTLCSVRLHLGGYLLLVRPAPAPAPAPAPIRYNKMTEPPAGGYPAVATILGCPEELSSTNGLVATPIGINGELQPVTTASTTTPANSPPVDDTSNIKDPIQKAVMDNIWGKLPTKNPIEKIRCEVCNVECIGKVVYNTHLNGAKHARKLKELEIQKECATMTFVKHCKETNSYTCTVCHATLNAYSQIAAHVSGAKHKAKISSRDKIDESNAVINSDPVKPRKSKPSVDATANLLYCATCNVHVNSTQQLEQHTSSRKHINRVNGNKDSRPAPYYKQTRVAPRGRGGGVGVPCVGGPAGPAPKPNYYNGGGANNDYWHHDPNSYSNLNESFVHAGQYNPAY